jgi:hypothetical protein
MARSRRFFPRLVLPFLPKPKKASRNFHFTSRSAFFAINKPPRQSSFRETLHVKVTLRLDSKNIRFSVSIVRAFRPPPPGATSCQDVRPDIPLSSMIVWCLSKRAAEKKNVTNRLTDSAHISAASLLLRDGCDERERANY